jgi:RNA recognition motif-containing protein
MKIYVSNLSFNTGDAELNDLFASFGEVSSAKIITDRETGRSRGFGFVEMASEEEGQAAITGLDNKLVEGRNMSASIAKEKTERNSNFSGGGYSNKKW